jgi:hypothetical protein
MIRLKTRGRLAMPAVALAVVVANAPSLLAFSDTNPLGPRSELARSVTSGLLPGERAIDPNDGFTSQALGHRAALDLVHFQLPWWNPYEGTGAPLAGEMQSAALFPPTLLTLVSNGQIYERVLLEFLAGLSTFLLLRRLSLGEWPSAAAATTFALNGTFAWLAHAPVNPVASLPALLLGVELAYEAALAGRRGGWWLIGVAVAGSFYAGFPEVAAIDTLFALTWLAWRCGRLDRRARALAGKAACGALAALLLSAPLVVASLDYSGDASLGAHAGTAAGSTHLPAQGLSQLVLPYVFGPLLAFGDPQLTLTALWGHVGGFLSTSLLLLALLGLCSRGRRGLRLLLLGWVVFALARIYGEPRLLSDAVGLLPGMSHIAFYRYAFPAVELAVIVLAAFGLDELATTSPSRRRLGACTVSALAVVAVAALEALPLAYELQGGFSVQRYVAGSAAWGATIVLGVAAAAVLRNPRARVGLVALLVAVDALVLFAFPQASAPRKVQLDLEPVAFLQRHLGTSRFFTLGPLQPNYGSYFGLGSLNVNDVPVPSAFASFVHTRLDTAVDPMVFVGNTGGRPVGAPPPVRELLRNLPAYRAAGVSYVLTPADRTLPLELVFRSPSARIYRLTGAAPYFTASGCTIETRSRSDVQISCAHSTVLVRHETELPGWSAEIDGRRAPVRRIDRLFQAVAVGSGTHRVTFGYSPPSIGWGFAAFAAGCAWLVLARARRS